MSYFNASISAFVPNGSSLSCTIDFASRAINEAEVIAYSDGRSEVFLDFGGGKTYKSGPYTPGGKPISFDERLIMGELRKNIGDPDPIQEIMAIIESVQYQLLASLQKNA